MDRRQKRNSERQMDNKIYTWITWILLIIGVIAFIVSYKLYGRRMDENIGLENIDKFSYRDTNMLNNIENDLTSEVSFSIGKSVNEIENEEQNVEEEKIAINTSSIENKTIEKRKEENEIKEVKEEKIEETIKDPTFIRPVDGEIIKEYSSDNLLYSQTLDEWTTHLGIDYAAEKTSIVKAASDGIIKSIKNDPRYGLTVVIEHANGYNTMYSNLLSTEFINVGESVSAGQTIATVGNTAAFEIADETHLHFEILKDGLSVDPSLYIN